MRYKEKLTLIIPCYNEEKNIPDVIPEIITFCEKNNFALIVVNDGSSDKSKALLEKYSSPCYSIINHKVNRGYGGAIKTGIKHASTDLVVSLDADGQHNLCDIKNIYNRFIETNADMIVGSRAKLKSASRFRGLGKFIIRMFCKFLINPPVEDMNSGLKMYRRKLALKLLPLCPDSMAYSDIIMLLFVHARSLVLEEPITINQRLGGESTINTLTAIDTISEILCLVVLFKPLKLFGAIALILFAVGLIWGIICFIGSLQLSTTSSMLFICALFTFLVGLTTDQLSRIRMASVENCDRVNKL